MEKIKNETPNLEMLAKPPMTIITERIQARYLKMREMAMSVEYRSMY